jgi:RIO1 family
MRNLRRLHAAGIPSPCPVMVKSNVLVMEFLGENGWPAPRYTIYISNFLRTLITILCSTRLFLVPQLVPL